jgi:molybdopterin converting factor small subunit
MKVCVKIYGAELPQLLGRALQVEIESVSTLQDLISKLERKIKEKHGWTIKISSPNFNVLINRKRVHEFKNLILKKGDVITILSPIGGG